MLFNKIQSWSVCVGSVGCFRDLKIVPKSGSKPNFGAWDGVPERVYGHFRVGFFYSFRLKIQNCILDLLSGTKLWLIFGFWGDSLVNNPLIRQLTSGYRRWRRSPVDNNKLTKKKKISPSFPNELMVQNSDEIW